MDPGYCKSATEKQQVMAPKMNGLCSFHVELSLTFHSVYVIMAEWPHWVSKEEKKRQYFIISVAPMDAAAADALVLTTQVPWQQCPNDALLLQPLIHDVWVVIEGSFQPGMV